MIGIVVVLLVRLIDPISVGAALLVARVAAGASRRRRRLIVPAAALAISAGAGFTYCMLQSSCREPFDGQGIVIWLIGSVASVAHLVIAFAAIDWYRRRRAGKSR